VLPFFWILLTRHRIWTADEALPFVNPIENCQCRLFESSSTKLFDALFIRCPQEYHEMVWKEKVRASISR